MITLGLGGQPWGPGRLPQLPKMPPHSDNSGDELPPVVPWLPVESLPIGEPAEDIKHGIRERVRTLIEHPVPLIGHELGEVRIHLGFIHR